MYSNWYCLYMYKYFKVYTSHLKFQVKISNMYGMGFPNWIILPVGKPMSLKYMYECIKA